MWKMLFYIKNILKIVTEHILVLQLKKFNTTTT